MLACLVNFPMEEGIPRGARHAIDVENISSGVYVTTQTKSHVDAVPALALVVSPARHCLLEGPFMEQG
jgi:hypothetical protein